MIVLLSINFLNYIFQACGEIASKIGIFLLKVFTDDEYNIVICLEKCLQINFYNLCKCRHKGAIEAAGLSLGHLVNYISSNFKSSSKYYSLLYHAFPILMGDLDSISTTRRGAGFSIMFHHLIKNDTQINKVSDNYMYYIRKKHKRYEIAIF